MWNLQVKEVSGQVYVNDISRPGVIFKVKEQWPIGLHMVEEV